VKFQKQKAASFQTFGKLRAVSKVEPLVENTSSSKDA
jgi:hypothetical protein